MLITQTTGALSSFDSSNRPIDWLDLEWYETRKRILRKHTRAGREVAMKFLTNNTIRSQDDVLYADDSLIIAINILPCDVLVISPASLYEMASACYEIGNKHLPLYFEQEELLVPFEMPLYRLLQAQGYAVKQEQRKLLNALKTTVAPHATGGNSLFSKIMQLTNTGE